MIRRAKWFLLGLAVVGIVLAGAAWRSYVTTPTGSQPATGPVDAIVVFGSPAEMDGSASAMEIWRLREAIAEYQRGVAHYIICTGGPAANRYIEADVMARRARRLGIPAEAIFTERESRTTLENLQGVTAIMRAHGWKTAELISSADHLPRIAVIAQPMPFAWRLHPAPTPGRGRLPTAVAYGEEAAATLVLRTFGTAAEPVIHMVATIVHWIFFVPRWLLWHLRSHPPATN